MTNVHHLFNTTPEQRAKEGLKEVLSGSDTVAAGWLKYGAALNEIKAQHPGEQGKRAFGEAVSSAGLDKWPSEGDMSHLATYQIGRDVRAAAMWAASLTASELAGYEAAHPDIEVTAKGGFRGLHAAVVSTTKARARSVTSASRPTPTLDKAREVVAAVIAKGEPIRARKLAEEHGISHVTVETAAAVEKAVAEAKAEAKSEAQTKFEAPAIDIASLSPSARERFEAAKRQMERKVESDFNARVSEATEKFINEHILPLYKKRLDDADRIRNAYRGIMTRQEYNLLLSCLHPDSRASVSDERLSEAFQLLRSKEIVFLPGADTATPSVPLANSFAEAIKRKAEEKAARQRARSKTERGEG